MKRNASKLFSYTGRKNVNKMRLFENKVRFTKNILRLAFFSDAEYEITTRTLFNPHEQEKLSKYRIRRTSTS